MSATPKYGRLYLLKTDAEVNSKLSLLVNYFPSLWRIGLLRTVLTACSLPHTPQLTMEVLGTGCLKKHTY